MKIFKDNKCFVEVKDLMRLPLPEFINAPSEIEGNSFVSFEKEEEIVYFKDRIDILDYESVSRLTDAELDNQIASLNDSVASSAIEWLMAPNTMLDKPTEDRAFNLKMQSLKFTYAQLVNYKLHRAEFDQEVQKLGVSDIITQSDSQEILTSSAKKKILADFMKKGY